MFNTRHENDNQPAVMEIAMAMATAMETMTASARPYINNTNGISQQ